MSMYELNERDVIHIKVKYCDNESEPQIKKFAIDPRLTNYDILRGLLIKGFIIRRDFIIHYLATDDVGDQFYLPLMSDWDLDAAILTASDPILRLRVNIKRQEKDPDEWDIVGSGEMAKKMSELNFALQSTKSMRPSGLTILNHNNRSNTGSFLNQMYHHVEKTVTSVQKAFSNSKINDSVQSKVMKSPMSDIEFKNYMDNIGRIIQPDEFRQSVYLGGLEPSLRKVGWRLLLNVYPIGLTGRERLNLLDKKTKHYRLLKHAWKQQFKLGKLTESQMAQIALVSVDVIRTDRSLNFYSGEKNQHHVAQLFDILATYCIYHPSIGYYQGMSDLASPLLFVQCDEAVAYLCFCSLMRRLNCNFINTYTPSENLISLSDDTENCPTHCPQSGIMHKLGHFYHLLFHLDKELALFLREKHLATLFFAHRWILLEMKREFSFLDSLRLLEVQWASLPRSRFVTEPPKEGVSLLEDGVCETVATNSSQYFANYRGKKPNKVRCYAVRDMSLICSLVGQQFTPNLSPLSSPSSFVPNSDGTFREFFDTEESSDFLTSDVTESDSGYGACANIHQQRHKLARTRNSSNFSSNCLDTSKVTAANDSSVSESSSTDDTVVDTMIDLPPPDELGHGNPFLLFLCVSLLLEYRALILAGVHEASDILVLYQKLNHRHNLNKVLNRARLLFDQYLCDHELKRRNLIDFPDMELNM